jgi:hypothetical protein
MLLSIDMPNQIYQVKKCSLCNAELKNGQLVFQHLDECPSLPHGAGRFRREALDDKDNQVFFTYIVRKGKKVYPNKIQRVLVQEEKAIILISIRSGRFV